MKGPVVQIVGNGLEEANGARSPQRRSRGVAGPYIPGLQALLQIGHHLRVGMDGQHDLLSRIPPTEPDQGAHDGLRLIDWPLHHGQNLVRHRDRSGLPIVRGWQAEGVVHGGGFCPPAGLDRRMDERAHRGPARLHEPSRHGRQLDDGDEPEIAREPRDIRIERENTGLEAICHPSLLQEVQVPPLYGAQHLPACPVVEREARATDPRYVPEPVPLPCKILVQSGKQPGELVPLGGAVARWEMREHTLDGLPVHASKGSRPGSLRGHIIGEGRRASVNQPGEVSHGCGFGRNQSGAAGLGLIEEQLDDPTAGTPSRKDEGGGPEVGHGPLDVVLDEVGHGRRQRGPVPPEEHTFNGVCQS